MILKKKKRAESALDRAKSDSVRDVISKHSLINSQPDTNGFNTPNNHNSINAK